LAIKNKREVFVTLDRIGGAPNKTALKQACALVERVAKENCPAETGELRNSITYEIGDKEGRVGTNLEYAPYVHQGTGIYAANGDGRKDVPWVYFDERKQQWFSTSGQKPQPFLQDALDTSRDEIAAIFKNAIKEAAK
jgi:HK97 gp10 family phage protein